MVIPNILNFLQIYLKLENLQRLGAFKIRGAYNALSNIPVHSLQHGICTISSGNFAQALGWSCQQNHIPCLSYLPYGVTQSKLETFLEFGGQVRYVNRDTWFNIVFGHDTSVAEGLFVHPVCNRHVIAGKYYFDMSLYIGMSLHVTIRMEQYRLYLQSIYI